MVIVKQQYCGRLWVLVIRLGKLLCKILQMKTDELSLMNMHSVPNYSEGVSCQSQRRFPEEMGESSTGERVKENLSFSV